MANQWRINGDDKAPGLCETCTQYNTDRFPQVLVIYSSGYLRLKAGADPRPSLPFGQCLVLDPAISGTSTSFPKRTFYSSIPSYSASEPGVVWLVGLGLPLLLSAKHRKFTRPGRDPTKLGLYARTLGIFLMPVETGKIRTNLSCM